MMTINVRDINIPEEIIEKWQNVVNVMAKTISVPVGLIMKVDPPFIEVFRSSETVGNPYKVGDKDHLTGLYCETVIKSGAKLFVPNALKDKNWDKNPDIKLGMISYLGFPLNWPEGEAFGTICVLDSKENPFSTNNEELVLEFKEIIEAHLRLLLDNYKLENAVIKQKKTEVALSNERDNFLNILNSMEDGVYIVNQQYETVFANPSLIKVFGPFNDMKCYEYLHNRDNECPWCKSRDVFAGKTVRWEWYSPLTQRTYDVIDTPLKNPDGSVSKLEIFRDITEFKLAQYKLKESEQNFFNAYNIAEIYKNIFAHDMNNILQNIQSSIELISIYQKEAEIKSMPDYIEEILREQFIRGKNLVSNIRRLSQIDETEFNLTSIEIIHALKNSIKFISDTHPNINLNIQLQSNIEEVYVQANELISDMFENILYNAVKYTKNSIVEILVQINKMNLNGKNYLKIEFIDNGIGIPDSMKKLLFNKVINKEKEAKGMGLGLFLVKKIITNYDGKIWVEDKVEGDYSKGSNFIILLPED